MEVIYTDSQGVDVGIVDMASLDYDCAGEMDFVLKVEYGGLGLAKNSMWYVYGEEYMGIVEKITRDSDENVVEYSGTNTRGLLSKKIIESDRNMMYYSGNAQTIINGMISATNSGALFTCDSTSIDIPECQITPFTSLYEAIIKLLNSVNAAPSFYMGSDGKMHITADLKEDRTDDLIYDGKNTFHFKVEEDAQSYNHAICKSEETNGERYVIHLFADENGGIQPYSTEEQPLQDSDYILDKRNQILTGKHERTMLLESDVSSVENYILTTTQPSDWVENYMEYFTNSDGNYSEVEPTELETYTKLTEKPIDWDDSFANYYIKTGTDEYSNVSAETIDTYELLSEKPWDWEKNYGIYYERSWDGTQYLYESVSGIEVDSYKLQTAQPSDWAANFSSYYVKSGSSYASVTGTGSSKATAPKWAKNKYYTKYTIYKTPTFNATKHCCIVATITNKPQWQTNLYWSKFTLYTAPSWAPNMIYRQVLDHYAQMVEAAITEFQNGSSSQKGEMTIEDYQCKIGDIVGCIDHESGVEITEEVTNIIFKIEQGVISHEYTIGGI